MKTHSYSLLVCLCLIALTQSVNLRKQISSLQANNIPTGTYYIQVPGTGKVYQSPYVSLYDPISAYEGVGLIQATFNRSTSQSFLIEPLGNGNYKITAVLSTLVLTMSGTSPGAKVIQSDWTGAANQQWKINPFSNCVGCGLAGYIITSVSSGLPLGVSTTQDGSQVVQQGQGYLYQYVTVDFLPRFIDFSKPISAQGFFQVPDGNYMIKIVGINKVFDIAGASLTSGANLIQNTLNGGLNQKFKVQSIGSGKYKITALHSGMLLNVYGNLLTVGTKIIQWPLSNTANEEWTIQYYKACTACVVSGYKIVSVSSGLVLGAPNTANQQDGSIITQQPTNYPVLISVVDFIPY